MDDYHRWGEMFPPETGGKMPKEFEEWFNSVALAHRRIYERTIKSAGQTNGITISFKASPRLATFKWRRQSSRATLTARHFIR
jgi:hypothetical protein